MQISLETQYNIHMFMFTFGLGVSPKEICCGGYFCVVRTENEVS